MNEQPSGYVSIDDTRWPDPTDPRELAFRLGHRAEGLGRRDQLVLVSIVESYSWLVCMDSRTRQRRVMQLRDALQIFSGVGGRRQCVPMLGHASRAGLGVLDRGGDDCGAGVQDGRGDGLDGCVAVTHRQA